MAKKPDPSRPRGLSRDAAELFEAAMKGTERIAGDAAPTDGDSPTDTPPQKKTATPPATPPATAPPARSSDDVAPGPSKLPELGPGEGADVDSRTMARLRRGRLRPEARIDLHGMTQAEAHGALAAFIARVQNDGRRCVLVVTGKGRVSEGGGVLRHGVPQWLNTPALRPRIMGFCAAQPRDGGAGALYVLIRRARR